MKLKFKTLYDPKQKCFIHLYHAFGEPLIGTSTSPQLMGEDTTLEDLEVMFNQVIDGELIDIEVTGDFNVE